MRFAFLSPPSLLYLTKCTRWRMSCCIMLHSSQHLWYSSSQSSSFRSLRQARSRQARREETHKQLSEEFSIRLAYSSANCVGVLCDTHHLNQFGLVGEMMPNKVDLFFFCSICYPSVSILSSDVKSPFPCGSVSLINILPFYTISYIFSHHHPCQIVIEVGANINRCILKKDVEINFSVC